MAKSEVEVQRERAAAGKCCSCNQPATHGARCFQHWLVEKSKGKKFVTRIALGQCGLCGVRPYTDGKHCQECLTQHAVGLPPRDKPRKRPPPRQFFDKPWHQRNKAAGYCVTGGEAHPRPEEGHSQCHLCLAKKSERYQAKMTSGRCREPGCDESPLPGKRRCQFHTDELKAKREANVRDGKCAECGKRSPEEGGKLCAVCLADGRHKDKRKRIKLRDLVFSAYGGYRCVCCGEAEKLFLHIDHVNNDGASHRREIAGPDKRKHSGQMFYRWLRDQGFPEGFQVLCANCNLGKHRNGGICPHQMTS